MTEYNSKRKYCYRITHIGNLSHILEHGIVTQYYHNASPDYVSIGDSDVIRIRNSAKVRLPGFGFVKEFVPFYFTPRSIMMYYIITGYKAPAVPKLPCNEIIILRCPIQELAKLPRWFFTDGHCIPPQSSHFSELADLDKVDWDIIASSRFQNDEEDTDRKRRYQAEFLVHEHVPLSCNTAIGVCNESSRQRVMSMVSAKGLTLDVMLCPDCFFQ